MARCSAAAGVVCLVCLVILRLQAGEKVIGRTSVAGTEALVGTRCKTSTPLSPVGYVRAGSELWRARSVSGDIDAEVEVIISEVKGLTLFVMQSSDIRSNPPSFEPSTSLPESENLSCKLSASC